MLTEDSVDTVNGFPEGNLEQESEAVSAARTRAMADHSTHRNLPSEDQDRLLKDATAAADICRCNPCRCDPLLNDCSVSCNPVVDASDANQTSSKPPTSGGCCGKKEGTAATKPAGRVGGCGCSCGTSSASSSLENHVEVDSNQHSVLPYHPQEALSGSQPSDSDPCCIVVCLKHLKRQFLLDRPKCCA